MLVGFIMYSAYILDTETDHVWQLFCNGIKDVSADCQIIDRQNLRLAVAGVEVERFTHKEIEASVLRQFEAFRKAEVKA